MNALAIKAKSGFTIIELLVVIVVIGILAAVTLIAYNGVQTKAHEAVLVSDLSSAAQQLELAKATNNTYPSDANDVKRSDGTVYAYTYNSSDGSYCLEGSSTDTAVAKRYVSSTSLTPMLGACPVVVDTWAIAPSVASTTEFGCITGCNGSLQLLPTRIATSLDGGANNLFEIQYACSSASCGTVTYTITADPPLLIADQGDTNWSSSLTRGTGLLAGGTSGAVFYSVMVPTNASSGTAMISISAASSTLTTPRIFTTGKIVFTK